MDNKIYAKDIEVGMVIRAKNNEGYRVIKTQKNQYYITLEFESKYKNKSYAETYSLTELLTKYNY